MHINITIVYRLERADKNRLVCFPSRDYRTTFRNNAVRFFFLSQSDPHHNPLQIRQTDGTIFHKRQTMFYVYTPRV